MANYRPSPSSLMLRVSNICDGRPCLLLLTFDSSASISKAAQNINFSSTLRAVDNRVCPTLACYTHPHAQADFGARAGVDRRGAGATAPPGHAASRLHPQ